MKKIELGLLIFSNLILLMRILAPKLLVDIYIEFIEMRKGYVFKKSPEDVAKNYLWEKSEICKKYDNLETSKTIMKIYHII